MGSVVPRSLDPSNSRFVRFFSLSLFLPSPLAPLSLPMALDEGAKSTDARDESGRRDTRRNLLRREARGSRILF